MWITHDEAIEMYARFWAARHGDNATKAAREAAKSFERKGDVEGRTAWTEVADRIEQKRHDAPAWPQA